MRISYTFVLLLLSSFSFGQSTREVLFTGAQGAHLQGTLVLPNQNAGDRCPAILLLQGSGPTDRDGNQLPAIKTDLLKQIAENLATHGIASLRYDKRGMGANAVDLPKDQSAWGDFFSWENFVGDAVAADNLLCDQSEIDQGGVGLLGHSEGGLIALDAARSETLAHAPSMLILLSTPGRSMNAVITSQLQRLLKIQGATAAQSDYFLKENERVVSAITATGKVPPDVPAGLAALYPSYLGKFLKSEFALEPAKLAASFDGPVLVVAGGSDVQVSPDLDAKVLDGALATRKNSPHRLLIVPQASHNLKSVKDESDAGMNGPVSAEGMKGVVEFAGSVGAQSP